MKKILFALPVVLLMAAGCNSKTPTSEPTTKQTQPAQQTQATPTQQQVTQSPTITPPATPTPKPTTTPAPTDSDKTKLSLPLSRDNKRLQDVRNLSASLELYNNDNNAYPKQLSNIVPLYMDKIPQAPTPSDGKCNAQQNSYNYSSISDTEYNLTFCLGSPTEGYPVGVMKLTKKGIEPITADDSWFTVTTKPTISFITPTSTLAGLTVRITITGTGFYTFAHQVAYASRPTTLVPAFDDLTPLDSRLISDTEIDAIYQVSATAPDTTYNISVGGSNRVPFTITR